MFKLIKILFGRYSVFDFYFDPRFKTTPTKKLPSSKMKETCKEVSRNNNRFTRDFTNARNPSIFSVSETRYLNGWKIRGDVPHKQNIFVSRRPAFSTSLFFVYSPCLSVFPGLSLLRKDPLPVAENYGRHQIFWHMPRRTLMQWKMLLACLNASCSVSSSRIIYLYLHSIVIFFLSAIYF